MHDKCSRHVYETSKQHKANPDYSWTSCVTWRDEQTGLGATDWGYVLTENLSFKHVNIYTKASLSQVLKYIYFN